MSTNLMNGPIWNMVKASLPKGASDAEIWKKTDKVLKENNMSWDSARKDQTVDGKSAPRKEIYQDLLGKKQEKKDTETKSPQKPTNDVKSTGPSDMVGTYQVPYYNNTGYQPSTGLNYNTWGNNYNYYRSSPARRILASTAICPDKEPMFTIPGNSPPEPAIMCIT